MANIGGGHKARMEKQGIKDPRSQRFTPGGRRVGMTSNMAIGSFDGCEEYTCEACGEKFLAFQTRCPECGHKREDTK